MQGCVDPVAEGTGLVIGQGADALFTADRLVLAHVDPRPAGEDVGE
ncbi:hypothetical protein FHX42_002128 [Saccharopolyspora lacisalsi]|uniref:Uncharacterized protein n=1 Tax=Halosaccharopolyspora lacisalsi TaxID=1000566 RepID=A0A839DZZ5_9PSEU|nr:hypothetical protein [Halosaccharopolyspora lacisalsi]